MLSQQPHNQFPQPAPPAVDPAVSAQQSARRWRFRYGLLWIPAAIGCAAWLINNVQPALTWQALMRRWGIHDTERFTRLFILGLVVTGVCAIYRVFRSTR